MTRWLLRLLTPIVKPTIMNRTDLIRYVVLVTGIGIAVALSLDVINQLTFFTTWATAFRSWCLTVLDAIITAVPISLLIGRAQRDLYQAKWDLEELSRTDSLTGLPNRRALMERAEATASLVMLLVIVDIDRFKRINDTYGHRMGDMVLRRVGNLMASQLQVDCMVGRWGGEEFALMAPAVSVEPVLSALVAFRKLMERTPVVIDGVAVTVTISAGAALRLPSESFERLYAEADDALYLAKHLGRNRIAIAASLRRLRSDAPLWDELAA